VKAKQWIILFFIIVIFIFGYSALYIYKQVFKPIIDIEYPITIYIPTGSTINTVTDTLQKKNLIKNKKIFLLLAKKKNYTQKIKPGKYVISNPVSLNNLINILRSGKQTPVNITFNARIHDLQTLSKKLSKNIEPSAEDIYNQLTNNDFVKSLGFNHQTLLAMFIPNTYQVYWNISSKDLILRLKKEYDKFWSSNNRKTKAHKIGLTPIQVSTLASIVCKETIKDQEKPVIAGVYINRLHKKMPLQADPTIIFANKAWSAKRVTQKMLEIDSPYNTYKHTGLPPGPICIPDIASIDAVLNYKKHNYLYFCAREDFSGYHNFARTLREHLQNARRYRRKLNQLKIYK
jgi:UPF0755 protein